MIAFRINGEELELDPESSIQVDYWNSLFETDRIPGMFTYPGTLLWSKKNKRLLGFPGLLSVRKYSKEPFACEMYLDNLWRKGKLYVLGTDEKGISFNFQSDIGDLGEALKNDSLSDIDLGSEPLVMQPSGIYPESKYALFPVRNGKLYPETVTWSGYVNYYNPVTGFQAVSKNYPASPFPYLVHIMRKVIAHYGYRLTGAWLEEEEARRLVIYNATILDTAEADQVVYNQHVPDMKVNEFLKAIRAVFCLGFLFNTTTREIEIVRLKDVIANTGFADWRKRLMQVKSWKPSDKDGFILELLPDKDDELNKELPIDAYTLKTGSGKDPIKCQVGTLSMVSGPDAAVQNRNWLTPDVMQKASLPGEDKKFSFSLLSYRGLQPDSQSNLYPLGSSGTTNQNGFEVGSMALAWPGEKGLYKLCHQDWLTFLEDAETVESEINLNITDLRTLKQDRKVLTQEEHSTLKALWSKISVSISLKDGIKTAKATFLKARI